MDKKQVAELKRFAVEIRKETVKTIASLGSGHVGGSLSMAEVLAVLYGGEMRVAPSDPKKEDRDWLVVSKGHSGPAVYSALALKGFFDRSMLSTLNRPETDLPSHCDMNHTPGVDMTTGSLGQGASSAAGIACGNRLKGLDNWTYLILGDGECQEGQVWESFLFAAQQELSHLIAFIDWNKCQLDGFTDEVCGMGNLEAKLKEFGWDARTVDGHDVAAIAEAVREAKKEAKKPSMIVLDTVKGKGISIAEGKPSSHSMSISREEEADALKELDAELAAITE
ncbi:MAG: transketolase [Lachnospiraceae bacterium]|nr:transketolase [Lachnospiraceae bacterium]